MYRSCASGLRSLTNVYVNKSWIKTMIVSTIPHAGISNVLIRDTMTPNESSWGNQINMWRVPLMWSSFAWFLAMADFNHSDPLHGGAANHWFHYKCPFFHACCWLSAERIAAQFQFLDTFYTPWTMGHGIPWGEVEGSETMSIITTVKII